MTNWKNNRNAMNQTRKYELLEKYHAGRLTEAENLELEQCIEAGLIELDELEDIRQLNYQLSGLAEELSSLRMRTRFKEELTDLIDPQPATAGHRFQLPQWLRLPAVRWAFAAILPVLGWTLAWWQFSHKPSAESGQLAAVQTELENIRTMMMMTLLQQESSSERLKAVHLVREINLESANRKITEALFSTLNNDPNPNVRLACIDELSKYLDAPEVREGLVRAIQHQDSPLVMLSLADVMIAIRDKQAVDSFKKAFDKAETPPEVRNDILGRLSRAI